MSVLARLRTERNIGRVAYTGDEDREERERWHDLGWDRSAELPAWPQEVADQIRRYIESGNVMEPVILHSIRSAVVAGVPVVDVIYEHPMYSKRNPIGLRLRVDDPPLGGAFFIGTGDTALDRFADYVTYLVIGEPPGMSQFTYVRDDAGVWWHGYGWTEPPGRSDV